MKNILPAIAAVGLLSLPSFAHNTNGPSSDDFGIGSSGSSMFHIPMKIDFDGNITFGYKMSHAGHSGHSGHTGHTGHGDMNHGGNMGGGDMNHGGNMSGGDMNHGGNMGGGDMNHSGDMGDGNMNGDDSMDHDSSDHNNNHNSSNSHDDKSIHWHVMPMLSLGLDKVKRIIALEDNKIRYVEAKRIEVGAGLMVMGHLMKLDWDTMLMAGLMPYKGKYQYVERTLNDRSEINSKSFFKVPSNEEQLASWQVGDKLSYSSHGGVMAHGGVTFGHVLDITKDYMFQGQWRVALEKIGPSLVKATLINDKMKHASMTVGNMVMSFNTGKMKMQGKSETYIFDLSNEEASKAYVHLLSGDLTLAQDLESTTDAVYKESFGRNKMTGRLSVATLQIPTLFIRSNSKMNMYSLSHSTNNDFGMQVETDMSMYSYDKTTSGIFSKHKKRSEMFMSMAMKVTQNQNKHVNYAGTWKRLFERDNVTKTQLNKELNYLFNKTGINDVKSITRPNLDNLGYLRTDFEMNLTQGATDKLIAMAQNEKRSDLLKDTYAVVNSVFNKKSFNTNKLCKGINFKSCHKKMIDVTSTAVVKMWDALQSMKTAKEQNNWKAFTKHYAKFGKALMDNQLSLKSVLNKLEEKDYKFKFNILGEKVVQKTYNF